MKMPALSVREMESKDILLIADYWLHSEPDYLRGMGVDLARMPAREEWEAMLHRQLEQPYEEKQSYCLIWEVDGVAAGHNNVNQIIFGKEAYMHLHFWTPVFRAQGLGTRLLALALPHFFRILQLQVLYCEPWALNPSPNRILPRAGFEILGSEKKVPGYLNFEQEVNRWIFRRERLAELPGYGG